MAQQANVTLYTTRWCGFCVRAKALLEQKGARYTEIPVDQEPEKRQEMMQLSGRHTVPQIWVGNVHVGGCDELYAMEHSGQLDQLLKQASDSN